MSTSSSDEQWCYEDCGGDCETGGWLTGHPGLVTCALCIEMFGLARYRAKHFDSPTKSCYEYGCTVVCPVLAAWSKHYERT